jgi:anaerobic ribonucleoside-triphosphate reductase activating protein
MIAINRVQYPVTVLGYGKRLGIWTQGCSIGCVGCMSKDTWLHDTSKNISIDKLINWVVSYEGELPDGLTISGGEPFEQPNGLLLLLQAVNTWRKTLTKPFDILCYSGYSYKKLHQEYQHILDYIDVVITEPYNERLETAYLRGSTNQEIIILTSLGNERYAQENSILTNKKFQVAIDRQEIHLIGIPERSDINKLEAYCADNGLNFINSSWQHEIKTGI